MLTSRRAPRVVRARSLHSRKGRRSEQAFLVEGPILVAEALAAGLCLEELFIGPDATVVHREVVSMAGDSGVPTIPVSPDVLGAIAEAQTPQAMVAVARAVPPRTVAEITSGADMVVGLDRVADPGNLGSIVRTAEAAGAQGVLLLGSCADAWSPKAVRASAGAAFRVPVALGDDGDVTTAARSGTLTIVATAAEGGEPPWAVVEQATGGLLWLFGSESHGLDPALARAAHTVAAIPMAGSVESLNLAASVAVCLFSQSRARMTD